MTHDAQPPAHPHQPAVNTPRARTLFAGAAGFVLAAIIAVALIAGGVIGSDSDNDATTGTSTRPITLPERLGDFVRYADVPVNKQAVAQRNVQLQKQSTDATAHDLSVAYGGAPAAVETYADNQLRTVFTVWAVRAYTPPPVVFHALSELTGLAQQQDVVQRYGETYCELHPIQQVAAGQTPPPNNQFAGLCQRSDRQLTVTIHAGGSTGPFAHPAQIAALVDQVWTQVG
jgi:hypothetical protein